MDQHKNKIKRMELAEAMIPGDQSRAVSCAKDWSVSTSRMAETGAPIKGITFEKYY